jgi:hypothetical protein
VDPRSDQCNIAQGRDCAPNSLAFHSSEGETTLLVYSLLPLNIINMQSKHNYICIKQRDIQLHVSAFSG